MVLSWPELPCWPATFFFWLTRIPMVLWPVRLLRRLPQQSRLRTLSPARDWRFNHQRRAVNLDANYGWARGKADVLYVADAFEVMRKVNELLAAGRG